MFDEFKEIIQSWFNWFRRLPVLVKAFFWLVIMVSICSYACDMQALILGEGWLSSELPENAKGTRGMYWWGMQGGDTVQISFRVTPEQLDEFVQRTCIEPLVNGYNPFLEHNQSSLRNKERHHLWAFIFGKWQPISVKTYAGSRGKCNNSDGIPTYNYAIVVDQAENEVYTVYFQIHGTDK